MLIYSGQQKSVARCRLVSDIAHLSVWHFYPLVLLFIWSVFTFVLIYFLNGYLEMLQKCYESCKSASFLKIFVVVPLFCSTTEHCRTTALMFKMINVLHGMDRRKRNYWEACQVFGLDSVWFLYVGTVKRLSIFSETSKLEQS